MYVALVPEQNNAEIERELLFFRGYSHRSISRHIRESRRVYLDVHESKTRKNVTQKLSVRIAPGVYLVLTTKAKSAKCLARFTAIANLR
jgi:hypothetical protein